MSDGATVEAGALAAFCARLLEGAGVPGDHASFTAASLVDADLAGLASHGVMLLPMYLDRLSSGSVSGTAKGTVVQRDGGSIVFDAEDGLGQVTARAAVALAIDACAQHGYGAVAVRNAFHFGAAGTWAEAIAQSGNVGIALCNTRPLMPAPGGAEAVVGNNPLAIALPCAGEPPIVVDFALSEAAMGKIRNAAAAGETIPAGWATDADGGATTDPMAAIGGMLLPSGGPKGFGLAVIVDLLAGALARGGYGGAVRPLYGDPAAAYNCSHFFLALRVDRFLPVAEFGNSVARMAAAVRGSRRAVGVERLMMPGDVARHARQRAGGRCTLTGATVAALRQAAADRHADFPITR